MSSIMHLLLPLSVRKRTGTKEKYKGLEEATSTSILNNTQEEEFPCSIRIKEKPPDYLQSPQHNVQVYRPKRFERTTMVILISDQKKNQQKSGYAGTDVEQEYGRNAKVSLIFKDKPPDLNQRRCQGIMCFISIKEEPPDAASRLNKNGGIFLALPDFSCINLIYSLAGKMDLRSNPFQEGENDMILAETWSLKHKKESKGQLVPELRNKKALIIPNGPMIHSRFELSNQDRGGLIHNAINATNQALHPVAVQERKYKPISRKRFLRKEKLQRERSHSRQSYSDQRRFDMIIDHPQSRSNTPSRRCPSPRHLLLIQGLV